MSGLLKIILAWVVARFRGQLGDMATYLMVSVFVAVGQIVLLPLVTSQLDSAEYGRLSIGLAMLAILMVVANPGIVHAYAVLHFDAEIPQRALFWACLWLYLSAGSIMIALAALANAAGLVGPLPLYYLVAVLAAALAETLFEFVRTRLRIERQALRYAWMMIVRFVAANAAFVGMLYLHAGSGELKFSTQAAVTAVLVVFYVLTCADLRTPTIAVGVMIQCVRLGLPFVPSLLLDAVSRSFDRFFIERALGFQAVGSYELSIQLAQPVMFIALSFMEAFRPILYGRLAKSVDCTDLLRGQRRILVVLLSLVGGTLSIFSGELVALLTRNDFSGTASILPLVVLSQIIRGVDLFYDASLLFFRRTYWLGAVGVAETTLILLGNALLLPVVGLYGAGMSLLVGTLAHWVLTRRLWTGRFQIWDVRLILFEVVICGVVLLPMAVDLPVAVKVAIMVVMVSISVALFGRNFLKTDMGLHREQFAL